MWLPLIDSFFQVLRIFMSWMLHLHQISLKNFFIQSLAADKKDPSDRIGNASLYTINSNWNYQRNFSIFLQHHTQNVAECCCCLVHFFVFSIFQAETKNGKWHLDEYVWLENTEIPQHLAIINCGQCAVFRSKGNCIHSKKT